MILIIQHIFIIVKIYEKKSLYAGKKIGKKQCVMIFCNV